MTASSITVRSVTETIAEAIENVVSRVPESRERAVPEPALAARKLARKAARRAAALSGTLALPPGALGMLTVIPDLIAIWRSVITSGRT